MRQRNEQASRRRRLRANFSRVYWRLMRLMPVVPSVGYRIETPPPPSVPAGTFLLIGAATCRVYLSCGFEPRTRRRPVTVVAC